MNVINSRLVRLKAALFLMIVSTSAWTVRASEPLSPVDVLLDHPLPATLHLDSRWDPPEPPTSGSDVQYWGVDVANVADAVEKLGAIAGEKIEVPAPIAAEIAQGKNSGRGVFWGVYRNMPARELFDRICMSLGMVPRSDSDRNRIKLDMEWRREDPRTGEQLVRCLETTRPVSWEKLPFGPVNLAGGHGKTLDPWRVAFDALLSKPENFGNAGFLRIDHDQHVEEAMGNLPVINLISQKMRDRSGNEELLILNTQLSITNKSPPADLAYYLFDDSGKFLRGGIYSMGQGAVGSIGKVRIDSPSAVTIDVGWGSFGLNPDHAHFALEDGAFVFKGATSSDGREMTVAEASTATQDQHAPPRVTISGGDRPFTLDLNAPAPVIPHPPTETPKPFRWHGAMGVLRLAIGG